MLANNSKCTDLQYDLSRWDEMKHWPFGQQHIDFATKIAVSLVNDQLYQVYERFIYAMDNWVFEKLLTCGDFRKTYLFYKLHEKKYDEVFQLIKEPYRAVVLDRLKNVTSLRAIGNANRLNKTGTFTNISGLLELWDEAHYQQREDLCGRSLTSVIKFRIRQRNPPPENICPSGLRPTPKLTSAATEVLTAWFKKNKDYPYPTKIDKTLMAKRAGITVKQVKTWFANARRRQKGTKKNATNGARRKYLSCRDHTVATELNTDDHVNSKLRQISTRQHSDSVYSSTTKSSGPGPWLSTSESIRALQQCCENVGAHSSKRPAIGSVTSEKQSSRNFSNACLVNENGAPRAIASPDVGDVIGVASLPGTLTESATSPLSAIGLGAPSVQQSFRPYHKGQPWRHGSSPELSQDSVHSQQSMGNVYSLWSPSTEYGFYNSGNNVQCIPPYTIQDQWYSREYWWHSYTPAYPTPRYYLPCTSPLSPPFGGSGLFEDNNVVDFRRSYNKQAQMYGENLVADNTLDVPFVSSFQVLEPIKLPENPFRSPEIQRTLIGMKENSNPEVDAVQGLLDLSSAKPDLTNGIKWTNI